MTMLKASAQMALQNSAKKAFEAEQLKLKGDTESANFTDKVKAGFKSFFSSTEFDGIKNKQKAITTSSKIFSNVIWWLILAV